MCAPFSGDEQQVPKNAPRLQVLGNALLRANGSKAENAIAT